MLSSEGWTTHAPKVLDANGGEIIVINRCKTVLRCSKVILFRKIMNKNTEMNNKGNNLGCCQKLNISNNKNRITITKHTMPNVKYVSIRLDIFH